METGKYFVVRYSSGNYLNFVDRKACLASELLKANRFYFRGIARRYAFQYKMEGDIGEVLEVETTVRLTGRNGISRPKSFVVNVTLTDEFDVYIGRWHRSKKLKFPASKWANPYPIEKGQNPEIVLKKYRDYVLNSPELMDSILELDGAVLGCFCKTPFFPDAPCHGDVLREILAEVKANKLTSKHLNGGNI